MGASYKTGLFSLDQTRPVVLAASIKYIYMYTVFNAFHSEFQTFVCIHKIRQATCYVDDPKYAQVYWLGSDPEKRLSDLAY